MKIEQEPISFNDLYNTTKLIGYVGYDKFIAGFIVQTFECGYYEFQMIANANIDNKPQNIEIIGNRFSNPELLEKLV